MAYEQPGRPGAYGGVGQAPPGGPGAAARPGAWVDLALTLPVFLVYHFGVVFLNVKNATDWVTTNLLTLAEGSRPMYLLITAAIGVVFAGIFSWLGRGQAFRTSKFVQVLIEGTVYAILMRLAGSWAAGLFLGPAGSEGVVSGVVTSLGAGFYEELAFRVVLFGLGGQAIVWALTGERLSALTGGTRLSARGFFVTVGWAIVCALVFSGVHYIGPLRDSFALPSFAFRATLGAVLTLIYVTRGFSTAVWAHAIYDVWVVVF
ncbi:MAG: CPBP family glutamic-type intramembrane protease [Polyangiaceae bacterium]